MKQMKMNKWATKNTVFTQLCLQYYYYYSILHILMIIDKGSRLNFCAATGTPSNWHLPKLAFFAILQLLLYFTIFSYYNDHRWLKVKFLSRKWHLSPNWHFPQLANFLCHWEFESPNCQCNRNIFWQRLRFLRYKIDHFKNFKKIKVNRQLSD